MLKVNNSRKSKMTRKQYFMLLGAMVAGLTFTAPLTSVKVLAESNEEVLFEDDTDDYKTEDIKEDDIVKDNTVVEPEKQEEKKEEHKEEPKQEEKKNDGGSCVTPEHGYNEEQGRYWDPNIKTEAEKKGLTPDTPPETPPTPPSTPENPTPSTPVETPVTPVTPAPTPAPTPKTGDLNIAEILGLLAGFGIGAYGIASLSEKISENIVSRKRK